jgi:hypothetical protein
MLARAGLLALVAATTNAGGCFGDGRENAHDPGQPLGSFAVDAAITQNTCGPGAFGEQSPWDFQVQLARDPGVLYWDNGAAVIGGTIAADGVSFSFDSGVTIDLRAGTEDPGTDPGGSTRPPCSVSRADHADGTLGSSTLTVRSFTGQLSYAFTLTPGSQCDDLVATTDPELAGLPCGFGYAMTGTWTSAGP